MILPVQYPYDGECTPEGVYVKQWVYDNDLKRQQTRFRLAAGPRTAKAWESIWQEGYDFMKARGII
jgi:hypothetical protein